MADTTQATPDASNHTHALYTLREKDGAWLAHALQYDLLGVDPDKKEAVRKLRMCLTAQIGFGRKHGVTNFFFPAPPSDWQPPYESMLLPTEDELSQFKFESTLASRSGPDRTTPETPVSLSEAVYRTGGLSGPSQHRLGVELGHIKPDDYPQPMMTTDDELAEAGPDRTTQEEDLSVICGECGLSRGEHSREAFDYTRLSVNTNNVTWKWGLEACPFGDQPFHPTHTFREAGPDRGQQDAPDWTNVLESLRSDGWRVAVHNDYRQNSETFTFWLMVDSEGWTVKGEGRTDQEAFNEIAAKVIIPAKAAREGQAPKGDRIKVEREPGCKCEYAIWTNAKGCPLHDVSDPVQAQKE